MSLYRSLASVGGFTLLSRATGFVRDVVLGATLGAGMLADAFTVAFRLPNHFRAIFGEGAFNAAYVPSYSRVLESEGPAAAKHFSAQLFTLLLGSQIVVLILALVFTRELLALLAPGLSDDPEKLGHALVMTRITFPYLLCVTLVTLLSGTMNANGRFAAAAFAPVLLNLVIIACLALAFLFPNAGVAASVGVAGAGLAELALMIVVARRAGVFAALARPRWRADVKRFFKAFVPAVIGSAGAQIAIFADTIIGSMLPTGGLSSIYYADRIYQLPIGVIGIAAGTVLLPEMSRRFAAGDDDGARAAQNRTMGLTIALTTPFFVAFLTISDLVMRGVFLRGAFTEEAAMASARVLTAYGAGLLALVLIRCAVPSFQARGDTTTPMVVALIAVAVNVALKIALFEPLGAAGLATATAVGVWINVLLLAALAMRRGDMAPDATLLRVIAASAGAAALLAMVAIFGRAPFGALAGMIAPAALVEETHLLLLVLAGAVVYFGALLVLLRALGVRLGHLKPLRRRAKPEPAGEAAP